MARAKARYDFQGRDKTKEATRSVQGNLDRIRFSAGAVAGAFAAAFAGIGLGSAATELRQLVDEADTLAKKAAGLGVTTESLENIQRILAFGGGTPDKADQIVNKLAEALAQAKDGAGEFGAAMTELGATPQTTLDEMDDLLLHILANWKRTEAQVDAVRVVFGGRLSREIQRVAENFDSAAARAQGLADAGIFTDATFIKRSEEFKDNMEALGAVFDKLLSAGSSPLLEQINDLLNRVEELALLVSAVQDLAESRDEGTLQTGAKILGGKIVDDPAAAGRALVGAGQTVAGLAPPIAALSSLIGRDLTEFIPIVAILRAIEENTRESGATFN